jgi:hypothetical protein
MDYNFLVNYSIALSINALLREILPPAQINWAPFPDTKVGSLTNGDILFGQNIN